MRIDVLEKIARAAGFAGACDEDGEPDFKPVALPSPDIPAVRTAPPIRSNALALVDARSFARPMQSSAAWLTTAPTTVARGISNLLSRGAPA